MKSITIHGIDEKLNQCLREKAREKQTSMNKTIKEILTRALGLKSDKKSDYRDDFLDLHGVWTEKEEATFKKTIGNCDKIDKEDWT